ncbi:MAG: type I DNA topoisomerase [Rhodospirillaceae bacterium]|nr:type I DNA topoisomerase [Rhodospirillaceae bacterium]MDE0617987.1 type I DNA topoisomerase [Rhodospirillaceae bacterium]
MNVVVVESPAKAKTINKYLGADWRVLASYGHVRDLAEKEGSVDPDNGFAMTWRVDARAKKRIDEIANAARQAGSLFLATDPDREGEAISWHVLELLRQKYRIENLDIRRVVFHEITRDAVRQAMEKPRSIDRDLVDAYLARRALDYLVGFHLSPVLWRKLPGARSAGRVQSVALRLVCEREDEIERFRTQEYWTVDADFLTPRRDRFTARLTHLDGKKLDRLAIASEAQAGAAVAAIEAAAFACAGVERKQVRRHPAPPFTTSTLQQEASRKLRMSADSTMRTAQRLYEGVDIGGETVGLISYMRTDSTALSGEAVGGCRRLIEHDYGSSYVPASPRRYRTKAKNAQEAHEAIRPTDLFRRPGDVARHLTAEQAKLYELIWKRTVASQMESAVLDQVTADIASANRMIRLRAAGSTIRFDGFLKLYREGRDDPSDREPEPGRNTADDDNRILPEINDGEAVDRTAVRPAQHFTMPPPRYTEASLVKRLEELGIGRPSTYASILKVLQDRNYVRLEKRRFHPEDRGRVVTSFLTNFFGRYVEYGFTAGLEEQLDTVSDGRADWKKLLQEFWTSFNAAIADAMELDRARVIDALDEALGPHFFPDREDGGAPRACPSCDDGRLGLKIGRNGGFIGCSNYPACRYTRPLAVVDDSVRDAAAASSDRQLGADPASGAAIELKTGPYGPYVQRAGSTASGKPERTSLPRGLDPDRVDLEIALKLLSLPRTIATHPDNGKPITGAIGRYGPYVQNDGVYANLDSWEELFEIGANRAVSLLAEARQKRKGGEQRQLGEHPQKKQPVTAGAGRYGPYVKVGRTYASLPKGATIESVTLEEAVALLAPKLAKTSARKPAAGKKRAAKKAPAGKGSSASGPNAGDDANLPTK